MNRTGVTLIELIIVIAIIGIIVLFATIDTAWFQRDARVTEARDRLLADIEDVKLKSLAQVPHAVFITCAGASYTVRRLTDANSNFKKDSGEGDDVLLTVSLSTSSNVKVRYNTTCTPGVGTSELWFDRKGIPKSSSWGIGNRTFTIWYDADGDNNIDDDETNKTIIISDTGRIQYEKR